jgi:hypothetical protein
MGMIGCTLQVKPRSAQSIAEIQVGTEQGDFGTGSGANGGMAGNHGLA